MELAILALFGIAWFAWIALDSDARERRACDGLAKALDIIHANLRCYVGAPK